MWIRDSSSIQQQQQQQQQQLQQRARRAWRVRAEASSDFRILLAKQVKETTQADNASWDKLVVELSSAVAVPSRNVCRNEEARPTKNRAMHSKRLKINMIIWS